MKKALLVVGVLVLLLVGVAGALFGPLVIGMAQLVDGTKLAGGAATTVVDGYSGIFVLDADPGQVALIDCGNDSSGAAILAALQITSELFQAREANGALVGSMQGLATDIRRLLPPGKRESVPVPVVSG